MQLHRAREEIEATGASLVVIGQGTPAHAEDFRRSQGVDLTLLVDPDRKVYETAGAKVATFGELLGPRVIAKGIASSLRSRVRQGRTREHPAQLGGTIIVAPGGNVAWAKMADDASDNASPEEVLAALRDLGA